MPAQKRKGKAKERTNERIYHNENVREARRKKPKTVRKKLINKQFVAVFNENYSYENRMHKTEHHSATIAYVAFMIKKKTMYTER
jgi:hypothetical protein